MNDQADTVRKAYGASRNLPVPCSTQGGATQGRRAAADPGFAAQMLGAGGQRRGLKGGAPVLQTARRAYLETQWSGLGDRRAGLGAVAAKRI